MKYSEEIAKLKDQIEEREDMLEMADRLIADTDIKTLSEEEKEDFESLVQSSDKLREVVKRMHEDLKMMEFSLDTMREFGAEDIVIGDTFEEDVDDYGFEEVILDE